MEGRAIIVSAPSGAGKTTIVHELLNAGLRLEFSVSACSRAIRGNETNGKDYYFLSVEEFKEKIRQGAFIEWEEVYPDHYYGTLKEEADRIWKQGSHIIFDVDVMGGINLKKILGKRALSIFIMPPSITELEARLRKRSTDDEASIQKRLGKAELEMKQASLFDRIIVNDDLQTAVNEAIHVSRDYLLKPE